MLYMLRVYVRMYRNIIKYTRLTNAKIRGVVTSGDRGRNVVTRGLQLYLHCFISFTNQEWQNLTEPGGIQHIF